MGAAGVGARATGGRRLSQRQPATGLRRAHELRQQGDESRRHRDAVHHAQKTAKAGLGDQIWFHQQVALAGPRHQGIVVGFRVNGQFQRAFAPADGTAPRRAAAPASSQGLRPGRAWLNVREARQESP